MINAKGLTGIIDAIAPFETADGFDNAGLLYESGRKTDRVLFALDMTPGVIDEASALDCGILVGHHPVMLGGITRFRFDDTIAAAVKNGVSLIAAHTNLDKAKGGINDVLAEKLQLLATVSLSGGTARMGFLKTALPAKEFAVYVKERLGAEAVFAVIGDKPVLSVAVCGGAFDLVIPAFLADADAVVVGELKHHQALEAKNLGLTAVAAGHFITEDPGFRVFYKTVQNILGQDARCFYSESGKNPFSVF